MLICSMIPVYYHPAPKEKRKKKKEKEKEKKHNLSKRALSYVKLQAHIQPKRIVLSIFTNHSVSIFYLIGVCRIISIYIHHSNNRNNT